MPITKGQWVYKFYCEKCEKLSSGESKFMKVCNKCRKASGRKAKRKICAVRDFKMNNNIPQSQHLTYNEIITKMEKKNEQD